MKFHIVMFYITLLFTFIFNSMLCMIRGVEFTIFNYFTVIVVSFAASILVAWFIKWRYPDL